MATESAMSDFTEIKPLQKGSSLKKTRNRPENNHKAYMESYKYSGQKVRLKRKKDGETKCVYYLSGVLHCYNVFLLIIGSGVLGMGIWLLVKDYSSREISTIIGSSLFEYMSYGLTAGGGAVFILAFCGCCGTMKKEKFVLGFYGAILLLVFILLIGCCSLGVLFRKELDKDLRTMFKKSIETHYGVNINKDPTNRLITDAWDAMQRTFQCCGAYGGQDNGTSWALYKASSTWHKRSSGIVYPYVPKSCCVEGMSTYDCQGMDNKYRGYPVFGPPLRTGTSDNRNPALHKEGCYDKALAFLKSHSIYIAIAAGSVPVLLLIGICISFYLCVKVRSDDDDDDDEDENEVDV